MPDFLEEDPVLHGREYAIVSFLSPDKVLQRKELWMLQQFRKQYVIQTRLKCFETFVAFLSQKHGININDIMKDFGDFSQNSETQTDVAYSDIEDAWLQFELNKGAQLQKEFNESVDFQTNIRGFKLRDTADSLPEAKHKAKRFAELDNHLFNISIVATGKWVPWDPNPETAEQVEYANDQLNTLMQKYHENQILKDDFWRKEKADRMAKAVEENMKRKQQVELQKAKDQAAEAL